MKSKSIDNVRYHKLTRSQLKQSFYLEDQHNKHESTMFHSPYKNGKPNKQYINPSLISSFVFYPKEYLNRSELHVTKKIRVKDERDQNFNVDEDRNRRNQEVARIKVEGRECFGVGRVKIGRFNEPEVILQKQLQQLLQYSKNKQTKKQKKPTKTNHLPVYLEKPTNYYKKSPISHTQNSFTLQNEQQQLRKLDQRNYTLKRKRCEALTEILKQQIKNNQLKKQQYKI